MLELNKIYQGDCLELMKYIDDKSIDMILCDLPYGTTACKWDTIIPFEPLWTQYKRIIKDNGAIVLTAQELFSSYLRLSNIGIYRYDWIWKKSMCSNFLNFKKQPAKKYENICVFYKKQPTYNPQYTKGIAYIDKRIKTNSLGNLHKYGIGKNKVPITNNGARFPEAVIEIKNSNNNNIHPTQKPVALFEYLIKTYTNEGDLILDNCIGSGTTAIACMQTHRNFIGMELEPKYVDIANKRIADFKQQLVLI